MVQGQNITAEIEAPPTIEIPRRGRNVGVIVRISLHNNGEDDFIAHARSGDDATFWHVLDGSQQEVMREKTKGKPGVRVRKGVHSYRTYTVAGGHCAHGQRKLVLDGKKLKEGEAYTIRGEIYGHLAETTFVAVNEAPPRPKKTTRKAAPKQAKAKKRAAPKKRVAPKRKAAAKKK